MLFQYSVRKEFNSIKINKQEFSIQKNKLNKY